MMEDNDYLLQRSFHSVYQYPVTTHQTDIMLYVNYIYPSEEEERILKLRDINFPQIKNLFSDVQRQV